MTRTLSITLSLLFITAAAASAQEPVSRTGILKDPTTTTQWADADGKPVAASWSQEPDRTLPSGLSYLASKGYLAPAGAGDRYQSFGEFDAFWNMVTLKRVVYHSARTPAHVVDVRYEERELVHAAIVDGALTVTPNQGETHEVLDGVLAEYLRHELKERGANPHFVVRGWFVRTMVAGQPTTRMFLLRGISATKASKPDDLMWLIDGTSPTSKKLEWKRAILKTEDSKLKTTLLCNLRVHRFSPTGERLKEPKPAPSLVDRLNRPDN